MRVLLAVLAGAAAAAAALGPCDPLVPQTCYLPFPNNFWLREGSAARAAATSASTLRGGSRAAAARAQAGNVPVTSFSNQSFPVDTSGRGVDVSEGWNGLDGFAPYPSIMTYFEDAAIDNCPRLWNMEASLNASSPTILLNAETGERVAHWVELDHSSDMDLAGSAYRRGFLLWPAARLNDSTRYIVAMRGLETTYGDPIEPSPAFGALRDNIPTSDPNVEERRALFADIFARLAAAGVPRASLQLAWDFTTASVGTWTGWLASMRDDALQRFDALPVAQRYQVTQVTDNPSPSIRRQIQGTFQMPWYVNSVQAELSARLVIDPATNTPVFQQLVPVNFTVLIPTSVVANQTTGRIVQYGHGLFGDQSEVTTSYLEEQANQYGYILGAVDWVGLCQDDLVPAALMVATDLSNFPMIPDRLHQGMINAHVFMRFLRTTLVNDPNVQFNGRSTLDPTRVNYYGNSLGGIMGSVYMATSVEVTRGVAGVPGGPFGILLPRSQDFAELFEVIRLRYSDGLDRIFLMAMLDFIWMRLEPGGYMQAVNRQPLPNSPTHTVLFQYGLGDAQVTWLAGHAIARSVGAAMFESQVPTGNETLFGFPKVKDTDSVGNGTSVIQGYDFGVPLSNIPFVNQPANKTTDTHELVRRTPQAQAQIDHFFTTGTIINTCGGPCIFSEGKLVVNAPRP